MDTGWGICAGCIELVRAKGFTDEDIYVHYGVEGINYAR